MFSDRTEAGKLLAKQLENYKGIDTVVLALPRGGVPIAYEIAQAIDAPLDIVPVRKIGYPNSPEFAIGAVNDDGSSLLEDAMIENIDKHWLEIEMQKEKNESIRRAHKYRGGQGPIDVLGKSVILVDDGVATGLTMLLAVRVVQTHSPRELLVAVPVGAQDAFEKLREAGVLVVTIEPVEEFRGSVGAHYFKFPQLTDEEVVQLLTKEKN
jgi:putative phosphoribosyl transferase